LLPIACDNQTKLLCTAYGGCKDYHVIGPARKID
jgi:hypothetical protein